jgi:hypothetical protein
LPNVLLRREARELGLGPEVNEKAHLEVRSPEVVEKLPLVRGTESGSSLHFYHDPALHEQVHPERADQYAFIPHFDWRLLRNVPSSCAKLGGQRPSIHRLEKTKSEIIVALVERADDLSRQLILQQLQSILLFPRHPSKIRDPALLTPPERRSAHQKLGRIKWLGAPRTSASAALAEISRNTSQQERQRAMPIGIALCRSPTVSPRYGR